MISQTLKILLLTTCAVLLLALVAPGASAASASPWRDDAPATTTTSDGAIAASNGTVANGGFETGTLAGWSTHARGNGTWYAYSGNVSPQSGHVIARPPQGVFAATSDMNGPGTRILYQDVTVPASSNATLALTIYYDNKFGSFHTPDTLAYDTNTTNQQYRVDIVSPTAPIESVAPGDVLANVFRTSAGDPAVLGPARVCHDLSAFEGQTVRLRLGEVATGFFLLASADDIRFVAPADCTPTPPPPQTLDLAVLALNVTPSTVPDHGKIDVRAHFGNLGNQTGNASFTIDFLLDGHVFESQHWPPGIPGGWTGLAMSSTTVHGVGPHLVEVILDVHDNLTETNESNNAAGTIIRVVPGSDTRLGLSLRPVLVPTEAGEVRHPLGRHEATLRACNEGDGDSGFTSVELAVLGGGRNTTGTGSQSLPSRLLFPLAVGECSVQRFTFDTPGVVGDFTLVARLFAPHDDPAGNEARAYGFRVVGDQGGVVLPGGARPALELPSAPATAGIVENATRVVDAFVNATGPAIQNVGGVVQGLADGLQGSAARSVLNLTEAAVCGVSLTNESCRASRGDAGFGAIRPCGPPPPASQNVLAWTVWYAVHVYEDGGIYRPATTPLNAAWPVPDTPLPLLDQAPDLCVDRWDQLHEAAG